jgi:hypothetical protein
MVEDRIREELRQKITFGINRTAILYNQQRLTDPEKYDFQYQWDHLWFQIRRTRDPGFFRKIFQMSHGSSNFQSNRSFVMKIILRDLCLGRFNTQQLSGETELESFHKKNKTGNYEPRHVRRRLNDEMKDLVLKIGRIGQDKRAVSYSTAFSLDQVKQEPLLDEAGKMWEEEVQQALKSNQQVLNEFKAIMVKEIFHERWLDLIELRESMLTTLGTLDDEVRISPYFKALHLEVSEFSPYFIILGNHLNSVCEIFWFMKKKQEDRASLLQSPQVLKVHENDIAKTLSAMQSIGWDSQHIVSLLMSVPDALMSFGFRSSALKLSKELVALSRGSEIWGETCLELISMLRNQKNYKEMLELSTSTMKNIDQVKYQFLSALLRIRHAEALGLNGERSLAVNELEKIFIARNQFTENYVPFNKEVNQYFSYVLIEKEPSPDDGSVPVKISVLDNLASAAYRISEYCLAMKYLEELLYGEADYFKRDDTLDSYLSLSKIYNEMIFKCNSKKYF